MAGVTRNEMARRGIQESLLSILTSVTDSIPEGYAPLPYADILAAYAVTRIPH